ncbi:MAG: hypothetical protein NVSMB17_05140 [Candidatus Dormibacteria bacterium]
MTVLGAGARTWRAVPAAVVALLVASIGGSAAPGGVSTAAVPRAVCGPGAKPETGRQGRISQADIDSGRAAQGFQCNFEVLGHFGERGGYKVERYKDGAGHECAYYDSTLLFPKDAVAANQDLTGVYVLDMANPAKPVHTATLSTPAMQSPHESLALNQKRGLLVAVTANAVFAPGFVDVWDVSGDCRSPVFRSSTPNGVLGHESGFAPDGLTFYSSSLDARVVTAVDVSNPDVTRPAWIEYDQYAQVHGISIRDDGNRAYLATREGLKILDVSNVQKRVINPTVTLVSSLTWPEKSTPQIATPVTIKGHPFLVEIDEFGKDATIGAARIIDIADETKPKVVSNIRLEVNQPAVQAEQAGDPGATTIFRGYTGHYCDVPRRQDPGVLACSFILSGLRLFDIRDPYSPKELGYFNPPPRKLIPGAPTSVDPVSNYAMSKPAFVPERSEIWYTDGNNGFYALKVTNGVLASTYGPAAGPAAPTSRSAVTATNAILPSTSRGRLSFLGSLAAVVALAVSVALLLFSLVRRGRLRA